MAGRGWQASHEPPDRVPHPRHFQLGAGSDVRKLRQVNERQHQRPDAHHVRLKVRRNPQNIQNCLLPNAIAE